MKLLVFGEFPNENKRILDSYKLDRYRGFK